MPAQATGIEAVKLREPDERLIVEKLRGIGFRATCRCGYRGPLRQQRSLASADLHWHKVDIHGHDHKGA